jgi:hypothetical protein
METGGFINRLALKVLYVSLEVFVLKYCNEIYLKEIKKKKKVNLSLYQAMEAHRVVRR